MRLGFGFGFDLFSIMFTIVFMMWSGIWYADRG